MKHTLKIDNLEKNMVQVKAQLRFVSEDAEVAREQNYLVKQMRKKKIKTTNGSTCKKKKAFL